jgi:hypothetical protein
MYDIEILLLWSAAGRFAASAGLDMLTSAAHAQMVAPILIATAPFKEKMIAAQFSNHFIRPPSQSHSGFGKDSQNSTISEMGQS